MSIEEHNFADAGMLRKKAEELLKSKQKSAEKSVLETDTKKLLHELQVHQIELEMQNEELRHANETTESALKKYTMLYDFSPMGYFTLDSDGCICDVNFTGAELLGEKRFSLIDSNFNLFIPKKSQNVFSDFLRKLYNSASKESCTLKLGDNNGPLVDVYIEGIVTGDGRKCLLSVVDISEIIQQVNL